MPLSPLSIPHFFIFSLPPRCICRRRITLSRLPVRRQMFLDCRHPHLVICPLAGSPYRQALSLTPHILSSTADATDFGVKLT